MKTQKILQSVVSGGAGATTVVSPLDHLEELIDELIKDQPEEAVVRLHMKAIGIRYTVDPVGRMTTVLNALEEARKLSKKSVRKPSGEKVNGNSYAKGL